MKSAFIKKNLPVMLLIAGFLLGAGLAAVWFTIQANAAEEEQKAEAAKSARRAQLMMQKIKQDSQAQIANMRAQFNAEKQTCDTSLAEQEEKVAALEADLLNTKSYLGGLLQQKQTEKEAVEATLAETTTTLETTKTKLTDLQKAHKQKIADLKFNEKQRNTLSRRIARTNKSLDACVAKNQKLYSYGKDLVEIYDDPNAYEAMMRKERIFQLKRVELENILQNKLNDMDKEHLIEAEVIR